MTWIRVDTALPRHPKIARFARVMQVGRHEAVGLLVDLWTWAIDYAEDGDLSGYSSDELMTALGVQPNGALFEADLCEALLEAGLAERDDYDRLMLHDWDAHQGQLIAQREANRERQRRYREKRKAARPVDVVPASDDMVTPEQLVTEALPSRHGATNDTNKTDDTKRTQRTKHDVVLAHKQAKPVLQSHVDRWTPLFPEIDLTIELEIMREYLTSAPENKTPQRSLPRFAINWLKRTQKRIKDDVLIADKEARRTERRRLEVADQMAALAKKKAATPSGIAKAKEDLARTFKPRWKPPVDAVESP